MNVKRAARTPAHLAAAAPARGHDVPADRHTGRVSVTRRCVVCDGSSSPHHRARSVELLLLAKRDSSGVAEKHCSCRARGTRSTRGRGTPRAPPSVRRRANATAAYAAAPSSDAAAPCAVRTDSRSNRQLLMSPQAARDAHSAPTATARPAARIPAAVKSIRGPRPPRRRTPLRPRLSLRLLRAVNGAL